ncbi:helix-turn-helix transcriptional regulator [Diplocloster modestus]|uniref:Helix-turn-helix domain-containing protein n=1 Tax=Diplocloster modestus TaxID=2850322 RepID=A0ABS6K9I9_9FIRM|nr:helix-turn-helix transcriptional regulator [Diplocloster modestus]MBU9727167.1 helix-turn-helix domain-containing protein [Diplocloster modestus]
MMLLKLGKTLAEYRHAAGLTQQEAADKIHVSRQCLGNWETGNREPRFGDIVQLCQLYGIELDQLTKASKKGPYRP